MMIDVALDTERQEGVAPEEAIRRASLLRLRPILMTTMAAMLGALPMALRPAPARSSAVRWASRSSAG